MTKIDTNDANRENEPKNKGYKYKTDCRVKEKKRIKYFGCRGLKQLYQPTNREA